MNVSLCILACNQVNRIKKLIDSVTSFEGLDVEVVIGDNSTLQEARRALREVADVWLPIEDRDLWFDGFGACKMKIVTAATHPWVLIADPDEVWMPRALPEGHPSVTGGHSPWWHSELLAMADSAACPRVLRTSLVEQGRVVAEHGRVFHRRDWRLMGMIHEEPYGRRRRENWSTVATMQSFASVHHDQSGHSDAYMKRKGVLYDNILDRITKDNDLAAGTRCFWWREYWPKKLIEGNFQPTSFEEWTLQMRGV